MLPPSSSFPSSLADQRGLVSTFISIFGRGRESLLLKIRACVSALLFLKIQCWPHISLTTKDRSKNTFSFPSPARSDYIPNSFSSSRLSLCLLLSKSCNTALDFTSISWIIAKQGAMDNSWGKHQYPIYLLTFSIDLKIKAKLYLF